MPDLPLTITITVDAADRAKAPDPPGVRVLDVAGGVALDVRPETRKLLLGFGWTPPEDDDA